MKKLFLLALIMGFQVNASSIQNGKIVTQCVKIENMSPLSVEINGKKMSGGEAWYIHPGSTYHDIKDNTITVKLYDGTTQTITFPLANAQDPITYLGLDKTYDITITPNWYLFGQQLKAGEEFKKMQIVVQTIINALNGR